MSLTLAELVRHSSHAVGGEIPDFPALSLVNDAGRWISGAWPWRFFARSPVRLDLRAPISIAAATWDEATLTLSITDPASALDGYVFLEGDQLQITAGTGADIAFYGVESADPATGELVLKTSIGADADTLTDIAGTLQLTSARLPADFTELIGSPCGSVAGRAIYPMSPEALLDMQAQVASPLAGDFYAAVIHADGSDGPVPTLLLYPPPGTTERSAVMVSYRSGWVELDNDTATGSNTPAWFDQLLIQAVRAYAKGIQTDAMDQELARVRGSVLFMDTCRRDASVQRRRGRYRGGAVQLTQYPGDPHITSLNFQYPS